MVVISSLWWFSCKAFFSVSDTDCNTSLLLVSGHICIKKNKIYLGLNSEANKELKSCVKYFRSNLKENKLGVDNELFYMQAVHQESDVIPENIDAIRALLEMESDNEKSIAKTNEAMGIL